MFTDVREYLKFGIPNAVMLWADWWAFELILLMSGMISLRAQAAQVVLLALVEFIF